MTLTRNVNGVDVVMSAAEETQVRAEWAANQPPTGPTGPRPTLLDVINALPTASQQTLQTKFPVLIGPTGAMLL